MSKRVIVGPQRVPDANRQGFLLDTAEKALNCAVAWLGSGQAVGVGVACSVFFYRRFGAGVCEWRMGA